MNEHDNLFQGTDFVVGSRDPDDVLVRFARQFGAPNVIAAAGQAGPAPAVLADLAGRLMTAALDGIIILSAAGAECLLEQAALLSDPERFLAAIADSRIVVAGPQAARTLARRQIESVRVLDEVSDWRAALGQIASLPELANSRLAIESTVLDLPLRSGLEVRGTEVEPVAIVAPPLTKDVSKPGSGSRLVAIACELDGLAGVIRWLGDPGDVHAGRPILVSPSLEIVEAGGLLGMDSRHIPTDHPTSRWGLAEAMEIARNLW